MWLSDLWWDVIIIVISSLAPILHAWGALKTVIESHLRIQRFTFSPPVWTFFSEPLWQLFTNIICLYSWIFMERLRWVDCDITSSENGKQLAAFQFRTAQKTIDKRYQKERKESRRGNLRNIDEHRFQICPITCITERLVWGVHQTRMLMSHPLIVLFRWVGSLVVLEVGDWNSSTDLRLWINAISFNSDL